MNLFKLKDRILTHLIKQSLIKETSDKNTAKTSKKVLKCFKNAYKKVPFYRNLIDSKKVIPDQIHTLTDFQKHIPIINKQTYFKGRTFRDFSTADDIEEVEIFYSSSGYSKDFSFNAETKHDVSFSKFSTEVLFNQYIDTFKNKTLLINCLSMGVQIHTKYIPQVITSARHDVGIELIKRLKDQFDQFVLIGEYLSVKSFLEDAISSGLDLKNLNLHIVMGGEFIPESCRSYLEEILGGIYPKTNKLIIFNMGLSELSNTCGIELLSGRLLRNELKTNQAFREYLLGKDEFIHPQFMHYFPQMMFVETLKVEGGDEMVVTMLDKGRKIPMIRYHTGDRIKLYSCSEFNQILERFNLTHLIPHLKLPVLLALGRDKRLNDFSVNEVKGYMFEDHYVASMITGYFKIIYDNQIKIYVQLKKGVEVSPKITEKLYKVIRDQKKMDDFEIILKKYHDFTWNLEIFRDRKFDYI